MVKLAHIGAFVLSSATAMIRDADNHKIVAADVHANIHSNIHANVHAIVHSSADANDKQNVQDFENKLSKDEHLNSIMEAMTDGLLALDGSSPEVADVMRTVSSTMDVKEAALSVQKKKLPDDVAVLVKKVSDDDSTHQPFSEESLDKARTVLNGMVETSWKELDDKVIECKEFEEQNRGTFGQVTTDLSRLVEQISGLQRIETESMAGMTQKEAEIADTESELEEQTKIYKQIFAANSAEITIRQNDLDVFTYILTFTKCEDATSLLQRHNRSKLQVCETMAGGHALHFHDAKLQRKYAHMLTPRSRKLISEVLGNFHRNEKKEMSLLQEYQPMINTTTPVPIVAITPVSGADGADCMSSGDPSQCMKSCPPVPPDCGLLHDKLSLMWGDYKDKVDELQMEMNKNEFEFEELKFNLNSQIKLLTSSKSRFAMQLAEARSNMAADRSEKKEKEVQREDLDKEYSLFMKACKKRVQWIMYQDMCALVVVRNAVLETSTVCPSASISDCELDAWIPQECSVSCDDGCPDPNDPYECGGWQQMTRKVVVAADSCGLQCPELARFKKCNQVKCPINCEMSEWSGWSKCTADCEGGVQGHTRSILAKPKNGGMSCNTVEESRPCNTMSCDRDCSLAPWTRWAPCSMACDGGLQERLRHVLIPTRGFGKCPKKDSSFRYEKQQCNAHECTGDETCVAVQDLILAIDGSGSVTEQGFGILRSFAVALIAKYHTEYFGAEAMRVGVLLFGNGVIMDDGSVSPAINVQPLTQHMELVKDSLEFLPYKKGFTNMAQAFALAETMYTQNGRKSAQSAILVITDGKPSFQFQTHELVQQLDDKNVQRFFMVVHENGGDDLAQMQKWASVPWETNLIHVPGLEALQADLGVWTQKAVVMFCPMSFSPAGMAAEEASAGYILVKESGYCGGRGALLSKDISDAEGCYTLAQGSGAQAFLLGAWFRRGYCYASTMSVDQQLFESWEQNRMEPACSVGWRNSKLFDFYAVQPVVA